MVNETDSELSGGRIEGDSEEISILDLLLVLAAGKNLIITLTFVCGIAAGIIAFITPESYTATAVILPPQQQAQSLSTAMLGQLGGLAGLAGQSLGLQNPADAYIGILESRTVADAMIEQFKLQKSEQTPTDTRNGLKAASKFETSETGMIEISVTDKDPQRAAEIANAYVGLLKNRNNELAITEASQMRMFFEKQWEDAKNLLSEAEWNLKIFQEQSGVFKADSQMEAVIQSMSRLRADITTHAATLERVKAGATKQNPEVQRLEAELQKLRDELRQLEAQNTGRSQNDPLLPTSMMPEAGLEYTRKLREVKFHEAMYEIMARQYEAARLDEARESPLIQVIDEAVTPDRKSAPRRSTYVLAGLIFGIIMSVFIVFVRHAASDSLNAEKMAELRSLLIFGKR